mmetsp:Transcript_11068/g.22059  ORF Transcript_11068/g.22059 Transcript_11068/m.22059 type:complete len:494 (-) Transcript_11068:24-1505(-)
MSGELDLSAHVEVLLRDEPLRRPQLHAREERSADDAGISLRRLVDLDGVVLEEEGDGEDAVDVLWVTRLHLRAEAHGLVLAQLLRGDGGDQGPDAGGEGVLLAAETVVGGKLADCHDGLLHLELEGGVEGHALALVKVVRVGVGGDDEELLGVHVDDGPDLEVLPVPARAQGVIAVDGELAALHHLLEGVPAGVRADHGEQLHGVVGKVVLEGELLEVAVEAVPVVPNAVKAEDFAVILEEAPASLIVHGVSELGLGELLHGVLANIVSDRVVPSGFPAHEFGPHGRVDIFLSRDGPELLLGPADDIPKVPPRGLVAVGYEEASSVNLHGPSELDILQLVEFLVSLVQRDPLALGKGSLWHTGVLNLLLTDGDGVVLEEVVDLALPDAVVLNLGLVNSLLEVAEEFQHDATLGKVALSGMLDLGLGGERDGGGRPGAHQFGNVGHHLVRDGHAVALTPDLLTGKVPSAVRTSGRLAIARQVGDRQLLHAGRES